MNRPLIQVAIAALAVTLVFVVQARLPRTLAMGVLAIIAIVLLPPLRGTPPAAGLFGGKRSQRREGSAQ